MPGPRLREVTSRHLRHRVEVLEPIETDDGAGGRTITWPATGMMTWAWVQQLSGGDAMFAAALPRARDTYRIVMRADRAPSSKGRIRPRTPVLPVLEVISRRRLDEVGQYLEIDAMVAEEA